MFFFYLYGDHRDLHVLTPSFPTLRSSDLRLQQLGDSQRLRVALALDEDAAVGAMASPVRRVSCAWAAPAETTMTSLDRKSTRLNSSHKCATRMPSSA